MIKILITIEYIVNLVILLFYHMHMFQLNSYFFKKHIHWMKTNKKSILIQFLLVLCSTILVMINNTVLSIVSIILLAISIVSNKPKGKAKIALKITNRVKRMLVTEAILIAGVFAINGFDNFALLKLGILNVLAPLICLIANFINTPMEKMGQRKYINKAKKIIEDMPNLIVIGVTGSYGKTSVKNFLAKTLSSKYEVLATPKNYNTTMGVVKTIREHLKPTHQIFICEMGATNIGDIKEICDIVKPKYGIITAIGPQHLQSFKSIENIIKTKFELADAVKENNGVIFLNYDNEYISKQNLDMPFVTYGVDNKDLDFNSYDLKASSKGLSFNVSDKQGKEIQFKTKLIGKHNIVNMTGAIAVANYLGISLEKIVPRIREIESVEHRLQLISHGDLTIIDDAYNANPVSSKSAIDTLADFEGTRIVVTPGLIELGDEEEKYNYELGKYMNNKCDYIYLVGAEHSKAILNGVYSTNFEKDKVFTVNSPQEAMARIAELGILGKVTVLLENDLPDNYK